MAYDIEQQESIAALKDWFEKNATGCWVQRCWQ